MLLNLEWRKLKGLRELMCAINTCLDTKGMGIARFSTSVGLLDITKRECNELLMLVKNL